MIRNVIFNLFNIKCNIQPVRFVNVNYSDYLNIKESLREGIIKRQANYNLDKLENLWGVYEVLNNRNTEISSNRNKIYKELEQVKKQNLDNNDVKRLTIQLKLLDENLKKLKSPLRSAEKNATAELLKLPNTLHTLTPHDNNTIVFQYQQPPTSKKTHLDIGKELDIIHFTENGSYYLLNDAAVFELEAKNYFSKFLNKYNYIPFSITDFCKSFIIEGCGEDHTDPDSTFILENETSNMESQLHLVGGASIYTFLAYHSKNVIQGTYLPLKFFSIGRQYTPSISNNNNHNLFNVKQSTAIETFVIAKNSKELKLILDDLIKLIRTAYEAIGYHFRLCFVPAYKLKNWESLRLAIEMYSHTLNDYVEVGNVSVSGDFLSKRLILTYLDGKEKKSPHLISGTILNVPKLLACVLEQDGPFTVPIQFTQCEV